MKLRQGADAILVGINTILADDPSLTFRASKVSKSKNAKNLRRIILDSLARTPLNSKIVSDEFANFTTIVISKNAPKNRVVALAKKAHVIVTPVKKLQIANRKSQIDLRWLLKKLGAENVTSLLIEGGGEANASFFARRICAACRFFLRAENSGRTRLAQRRRGRWREKSGGRDSIARRGMERNRRGFAADGTGRSNTARRSLTPPLK